MFLKDTKELFKSLRKLERQTSSYHGLLIVKDLCSFCFVISILMGTGYLIYEKCTTDVYNLGGLGDFIGGIIGTVLAFISILILYSTLTLTNKQIKHQQKSVIKQEIESHFFELIKIHRDNVSKIKEENPKIFKSLVNRIERSYEKFESAQGVFSKKELHVDDFITLAYLLFYYGNSNESKETIKEIYNKYSKEFGKIVYKVDIYNPNEYILSVSEEPVISGEEALNAISKVDNILAAIRKNESKLSNSDEYEKEGFELLLGQYFRHIYQTVKYINDQPIYILSDREKYNYVKMLRAQLSSYEQALLFWDSLSPLGYVWEMSEIKRSFVNNVEPNINKRLITKYQIIKNIPPHMLSVIHPQQFYKDVKFDWIE